MQYQFKDKITHWVLSNLVEDLLIYSRSARNSSKGFIINAHQGVDLIETIIEPRSAMDLLQAKPRIK